MAEHSRPMRHTRNGSVHAMSNSHFERTPATFEELY